MPILPKRGLLLPALLTTLVIRGAPILPAEPTTQAMQPSCPYGYFFDNGLCHPYSWAGPAVTSSVSAPSLPPQ